MNHRTLRVCMLLACALLLTALPVRALGDAPGAPLPKADAPVYYGYATANNLPAGTPVSFKITGSADATFGRLADATGAKLTDFSAYTLVDGRREFYGTYVFMPAGSYNVRMYVGNTSALSAAYGSKTIVVTAATPTPSPTPAPPKPVYYGYSTANNLPAGTPVSFKITGSADATYARLTNETGAKLADFSAYTLVGGKREFSGTYTFSSAGSYNVRMYAGNAGGLSEAYGAKTIVITAAPTPTPKPTPTPAPPKPVYYSYSTTNNVTPGTPVRFEIVTSKDATFARLADGGGVALANLLEYADSGDRRTFTGTYTFAVAGTYTVRMYAGSAAGLSAGYGTKVINILAAVTPTPATPAPPADLPAFVSPVLSCAQTVQMNEPLRLSVYTNLLTTRLLVRGDAGLAEKTVNTGYVDEPGRRVWTLEVAGKSEYAPGSRTLSVRASNGSYDSAPATRAVEVVSLPGFVRLETANRYRDEPTTLHIITARTIERVRIRNGSACVTLTAFNANALEREFPYTALLYYDESGNAPLTIELATEEGFLSGCWMGEVELRVREE